ncbi:MAG: hypothetical protein A2Z34_04745 [Planctomycetes bacterium RBG_16_59_8]|nr:MAG: hypothetical protein A2Z34_04745 [Planctomycetes bacterium RBG_16_59_8]
MLSRNMMQSIDANMDEVITIAVIPLIPPSRRLPADPLRFLLSTIAHHHLSRAQADGYWGRAVKPSAHSYIVKERFGDHLICIAIAVLPRSALIILAKCQFVNIIA